jgi:hypothetical protein
MATFKFDVTQMANAYFTGQLTIEADTLEDAREIIKDTKASELEELVEEWELVNGEPYGDIEIWDTDDTLLK